MVVVREIVLIVITVLILCFFLPIKFIHVNIEFKNDFEVYLETFKKNYLNATEYEARFEAFKESLIEIEYLNSQRKSNTSAIYGLTEFSDMTQEDFKTKILLPVDKNRGHRKRPHSSEEDTSHEEVRKRQKRYLMSDLPKRVDWREKNIIGKVINQGSCGACWALTVSSLMGSMNAKNTGTYENLSAQQIIDCTTPNFGCSGGDMCTALEWLVTKKMNVQKEKDYPFVYRKEVCHANKSAPGVEVKKYACEFLVGNEDLILKTLADHGPVGAAINAVIWQNYLGGVIHFHCNGSSSLLNHAVQIVGYDLTAEIPHYIVKNSWGESFGDKGYLYIGIGSNLCGIANEVTAVVV